MTAIISIAQHARPKPNGHIELDEAQLSAFSSVVVMTHVVEVGRAQRAAHGRGRDDDPVPGTRRRGWAGPVLAPLERSLPPDVDVPEGQDADEHHELPEAERPSSSRFTASGYRKTISMSKTMNSIAMR